MSVALDRPCSSSCCTAGWPPLPHRQLAASNCSSRLACARSLARHAPKRLPALVCSAQKGTDREQQPAVPSAPPSSSPPPQPRSGEELEEAFRWFDWAAYGRRFDVPWGGKELALGMLAWSVSFTVVGLAFIPLAAVVAGPEGFKGLSQEAKSLFALANQVCETVVGIWAVRSVVSSFQPLPGELFNYDIRQPFRKPDGWLAWGLTGMLLSPLVVYLAATAMEALGGYGAGGIGDGRGTVDAVSSILSMDPVTFASLFATTAILAPLLEETVFRGFLLTSLTKFMPTPAAVVLSSVAFGFVHLAPRDFPQLTSLGLLLGFSYIRSCNLLTPMLIHGTWNGAVLTILCVLASNGVDIQQLIHSN